MNALPYVEPSIETLLILSSFLLLLNGVDWLLNAALYCGLIGQILIGTAWGSPGFRLLAETIELTVTQLGYIGLIVLVFEGGLLSSFKSLRSNLWLSCVVAATGVTVPIALSFLLQYITAATALQSFAAGAALCSTSLGTTVTTLRASGYMHTRLGTVLTSAALIDDVVGLLMSQIIQDLGASQGFVSPADIVRPVVSSVGLIIVLVLWCAFLVKPLTARMRAIELFPRVRILLSTPQAALAVQIAMLLSLVTIASYAGASNLLASYMAGAIISWWDTECRRQQPASVMALSNSNQETPNLRHSSSRQLEDEQQPTEPTQTSGSSPSQIFDLYLSQVLQRMLKPMFFASIGFSIPLSSMFAPNVIWRGVVYSLLMAFGKLLTGIWLLRIGLFSSFASTGKRLYRLSKQSVYTQRKGSSPSDRPVELRCDARTPTTGNGPRPRPNTHEGSPDETLDPTANVPPQSPAQEPSLSSDPTPATAPLSLYPGLILGSAMVARGEIGYLISSLAQSNGLLDAKTFLVVVWAISICTCVGPLATGLLIRRVKRLQAAGAGADRAVDPLGSWGTIGRED